MATPDGKKPKEEEEDLKALTDGADTTFSDNEFQWFTTR